MQVSEDENAGPKSLINEAFGAYAELDNWKNKVKLWLVEKQELLSCNPNYNFIDNIW